MNLNEFAVGVIDALLEESGLRGAGADDGIGGTAEDGAVAAGAEDDGVGGEGADFHGAQVHGADAAADAGIIDDGGEEGPAFVLADTAFGFVAADLLVEGVEQLLAGGGAGEGGAVIESAAEAAVIEQALGGAIEHDTHAVEEINDAGSGFAHALDEGLVGEEIATIDGVVEVLVGGVAFALLVLGGVDATLGADGVRALDGNDGEEVHGDAGFGHANRGHQAGQSTTHDDDFRLSHFM